MWPAKACRLARSDIEMFARVVDVLPPSDSPYGLFVEEVARHADAGIEQARRHLVQALRAGLVTRKRSLDRPGAYVWRQG